MKANRGNTVDRRPDPTALTPREAEMWALSLQGKSLQEIAAELDMKVVSVKRRFLMIKEKLSV